MQRGDLHRQHGDWSAAALDFDEAEKLDPSLFSVDLARAQMLAEAGREVEAKAALDRFIVRQPANPLGYAARARVLMKATQASGAAEDFAAAISRSTQADPTLYIEHSRALHAAGRDKEAIQTLDAGIANLGSLTVLVGEAIDLDEANGHTALALARIEKVIDSAPRKERWLVRRATLLEKLGQPDESRKSLIAARLAIESLAPDRRASAAVAELNAQIDAAFGRVVPR